MSTLPEQVAAAMELAKKANMPYLNEDGELRVPGVGGRPTTATGGYIVAAANLLPALAADWERLREALTAIIEDVEGYQAHPRSYGPLRAIEAAKAALRPSAAERGEAGT